MRFWRSSWSPSAFGLAAGFSTAFVGKAFGAGFAQAIYSPGLVIVAAGFVAGLAEATGAAGWLAAKGGVAGAGRHHAIAGACAALIAGIAASPVDRVRAADAVPSRLNRQRRFAATAWRARRWRWRWRFPQATAWCWFRRCRSRPRRSSTPPGAASFCSACRSQSCWPPSAPPWAHWLAVADAPAQPPMQAPQAQQEAHTQAPQAATAKRGGWSAAVLAGRDAIVRCCS